MTNTPKIELLFCTDNPEKRIEDIARVCYQAKAKEGQTVGRLIQNMLKSDPQHETPLEHAVATFRISNVSRALTHQLVRHRMSSFLQLSQRYVDQKDFEFITPPSIIEKGMEDEYKKDMLTIGEMYEKYRDAGCLREDARYVLPNACTTEIIMTANFRQWRNVFKLRCDKHAQWEIRKLCDMLLLTLYDVAPNVFGDLAEKFNLTPKVETDNN